MKTLLLIPSMVCIVLTSCSGQNSTPTFRPSATSTMIATATSIPNTTPLPTISPTATITPLPIYNTKQVIFDYNVSGGLSDFDMFFELPSRRSYSKIVLYSDGQMIIPGEIYKQKVLSPSETQLFLSRLDALGFYSLESNQAHDPTDKLYNFEGKYEEVGVIDGLEYCILVNADKSRKLCVQESYLPFLIPKMKNILQYLDEYQQAEMTPYYPDRILLLVQNGRHLFSAFLLGVAIFHIFLTIRSFKVVHHLSTGRAVGAVLLPLALLLIPICIIAVLMLMGPAIGNVFSQINSELSTPMP